MQSFRKYFVYFALVCFSLFTCVSLGLNPLHLFADETAKDEKTIYFPKSDKKSRHEIPKSCHLRLVYLVEGLSQQVVPINLDNGTRYEAINFDFQPHVLALSADGEKLYVTDEKKVTLYEHDFYGNKTEKIASFKQPVATMITTKNSGLAYFAQENSKDILIYDLQENILKNVITLDDTPSQLVLSAAENLLYITYVTNSEVSSYDIDNEKIETFLKVNGALDQMALSYDGQSLYFLLSDTDLLWRYHLESGDLEQITFKPTEAFLKNKTLAFTVNKRDSKAYIVKSDELEIFTADFLSGEIKASFDAKDTISSVQFGAILDLDASFKAETAPEGKLSRFDASSTVPHARGKMSYHWDFGDGLLAVAEDPVIEHIYDKSGDFKVKLTASQNIENPHTLLINETLSTEKIRLVANTEQSIAVERLLEVDPLLEEGPQLLALGTEPSVTQALPSQGSIIFGQSVYDIATVSGSQPGDPTPTGPVTFFVDSTQLGSPVVLTASINNTGVAQSINYTPPAVGTYQFTAQYDGDDFYAGSSDSSVTNTFIVNKVTSTVNLSTTPNASVFGQNVAMTANVVLDSVSNSIATGNVQFLDGGVVLQTLPLVAGSVTYNTSSLTVGSHTLTAVYLGDTNFEGNTSNPLIQTVNKGTSTTSLTSSVNPLVFGNTTTLTANVTLTGGAAGTVTGNINFKDGATIIGTVAVTGGSATLNVSNFSVGTHTLTAEYVGDIHFLPSTSTALSQVVNQGTTSSIVIANVNPSSYGQSVTFTATVSVVTGQGTPTQFFSFYDGATLLGTSNLVGASATYSLSTLSVGTHQIRVIYSGDLNFSTSTSVNYPQVVQQAVPIVTIASSLQPSNFGSEVTFTSSVTAPTTLGLPTGTVDFYDGATLIGTGTLVATGPNSSTTSFSTKNLTGGTHSITARYSGDTNFTGPTSPVLSQQVILANTTTLQFTTSSNPSEFGQPIVLQANVVGALANPPFPPTGFVNFFDGATLLNPSPIPVTNLTPNTSFATLTTSSLSLGSHTLRAVYLGDVNYNGVNSNPLTQVVIVTSTASTTVSSHTPSVVGEVVTFTTTVNSNIPGTGTPTQIVEFYDGVNFLGTGTLSPSGPNSSQATFSTAALTLGSHQIKAIYTGDSNYTGSTAPRITQVVIVDSTSTVVTSSAPVSSNFGSNITFSATVTANAPGTNVPKATGTVSFYEGATLLGTGTLDANGVGTYSTIALYPGTHLIRAIYSGDTNYTASTSPNFSQLVINTLPTITTVTSSRNASPINNTVQYIATVTAITGKPLGTVTFFENGVAFATNVAMSPDGTWKATSSTNYPTVGDRNITATFNGQSAIFDPSNSAIFVEHIVPFNTTTTLVSLLNPSQQSDATFVATVVASGIGTIPTFTGTVTFYDGDTAISGAITVPANGIVTFNPIDLHFGLRPIRAVYSGDTTTFATSTSNIVNQQVQQTAMLATRTTVVSSQPTAYLCQSINLTATVIATQGFYTPSGTVTFFSDNVEIGSSVLNSSGVAVLPIDSLVVGVHSITATYNSDSNYAYSMSAPITQTILANPTTLTLTVIPALVSTPYGQELTFIARIPASFGISSGVVVFADESGTLATVDVDATGTAFYTSSLLDAGSHIITATFDPECCGDACFGASVATLSHTVTKANPNTILSASPSPSIYGNTVILSGTVVAYQDGVPGGTVSFYRNSTLLGTSPIIQGVATLEVENLPAGVMLFNATYNGDSNFIMTNFPSRQLVINKAPVTVSLTSLSSNPSSYGELASFQAKVNSNVSTPTGSVTFFAGSVNLGQVTLDTAGMATVETALLPIGTTNITAVYSGDSNFLVNTSPALPHTIQKSNTVTTLVSSLPNPSAFNTNVTFTINVAPLSPAIGTPTGTVTAYLGSQILGTPTLNSGVATFSSTVLPAGVSTITVVYGGDANFLGSKGLDTHTVTAAVTTIITPTSSGTPSVFGQNVTLSTKVSSTAGIPTGIVTFYDGTTELGVATLDSAGNASISRNTLSVGTHPITVRYNGNGNFAAVTSAAFNQVVQNASTTTVLTTNIASSVYGQPVTFTATVNPVAPGAGIPMGTVIFRNGTTTIGTATLTNAGIVSITTSSLLASSTPYNITATYTPTNSFTTSVGSVSQTVNPVSTLIIATSSVNPSNLGQLVTFNITVNPINTGIVIPNGTVTTSPNIGSGSLDSNGKITFQTSTLPAGNTPIVFTYSGNSNFTTSTTTFTQTVNQTNSTTNLIASSATSVVGEPVTFTATVTSTSGTPTGTVAFFDGSLQLGIQTLSGAGTASLTTSALPLGSHNIRAAYSGDTTNTPSSSLIVVHTITQATTAVSLSSSINPTSFNQSTMLIANITIPVGSGTLTGTVTFRDGATVLGTSPLQGTTALFPVSTLSVGSHTLTATYNGDANFQLSTSPGVIQQVNAVNTATTVSSSVNPSQFGSPTIFTATVTSVVGGASPTGVVNFFDGATLIGSGTLAAGQATLSYSALSAGNHLIHVEYVGSGNYNASVSSPITQTVNQTVTTNTLTASSVTSVVGQPVTFTATISSATGTPTGTVAFFDGSSQIGIQTLNGAGVASISTSSLTLGAHNIRAVYSGDLSNSPSASAIVPHTITQATTTVALSSSINPTSFNQSTNLVATITIPTGSGTLTGSVTFFDGATNLGTTPVQGTTATLPISNLSVGAHALTATYSGDVNFSGNTSAVYTQNVNAVSTTTSIASSVNPSIFGTETTFSAVVTPSFTGVMPAGVVNFYEGATLLGQDTLVSGEASIDVSNLSAGSHIIRAQYVGNASFSGSTSGNLTQVVNATTSTVAFTSSVNPSAVGETILLSATVSNPLLLQIPTGSVEFKDGPTTLGTATLINGVATLPVSFTTTGTHALTANYLGSANFAPASTPLSQTVNQGTTETTLTSQINPTYFGENATFVATVDVTQGSGSPTGFVLFTDGTNVIGNVALTGNTATLVISSLSVGSHAITANYGGDASFISSTSNSLTHTVQQAVTSTIITSSTASSTYGQPITLQANVTVNPGQGTGTPFGAVTFFDGSTALGTGILVGGTASIQVKSLPVGNHQLMAVYNGSVNFQGSTSPLINQTITQALSTTQVLASSPNPSSFGQVVTFFATVTTPIGMPTGTVTFFDNNVQVGLPVPVSEGLAIFSTNVLGIGIHPITATYSGDANYLPSSSTPPLNQVVNQTTITVTTVTTLTSTPNPSNFGEPVTFNVEVDPIAGGGIPTGVVTLFYGITPLNTFTLDSNGRGSFTTSTLPAGTLTIVALYSGDDAYSSSTATISQVVIPISTTIQLTSSPNPSAFNQPVLFTATVAASTGPLPRPIPSGTVSFFDGLNLLGTSALNNLGIATLTNAELTTGAHTILAVYNPDSNFGTSNTTLTQNVTAVGTTTQILSSAPNPSSVGEGVTFIASVSSISGIPSGSLNFYDGATLIGTAPLFNGLAIFNTTTLSAGSHSITASYAGNVNFGPSTSLPYIQVVSAVLPQGPQSFYGCRVTNKYINTKKQVNLLTWVPPQNNGSVAYYEIYRDAGLTELLATVPNHCPYQYEDSHIDKKMTYTYYIVTVTDQGLRSAPVSTVVFPKKGHKH